MNEADKFLKELPDKFNNIFFKVINYTAEVTRDILMPEFGGSYFHSEFGAAFRKTVCVNKSLNECKDCNDSKKCPYYLIFEPKIDKKTSDLLKITEDPIKPFILEPPLDNSEYYKINSRFNFNLILLGNAIEQNVDFNNIIKRIGEYGIGKRIDNKKGGFRLDHNECLSAKANSIEIPQSAEEIEIEFITPVRIEVRKKPQILDENSGFTLFILNLYKRLFSLNELYCRNDTIRNYSHIELEQVSRNISTDIEEITLIEMERNKYIHKTIEDKKKINMKYSGFTGRVVFSGYLTPFLNMIKLGEYLHLGKYSSFGFGKYRIVSVK